MKSSESTVSNASKAVSSTMVINGIDVAALNGVIDSVRRTPAEGKTSWRVQSSWKGGTRADHQVSGCAIGSKNVAREFTIRSDEPLEIGGTNRYANPQELLMASINACMMVGYVAVAALMGITLTKLEVELSGDIDLQGFFGLDANVSAGYRGLNQVVHISGNATPEQFAQLHDAIRKTSPNYYNITRAIPTDSRMIIETDRDGK